MAYLTWQLVFFLVLFILDVRVSRSLPRGLLDDYDADGYYNDEDVPSRKDGRIIFPSDDAESDPFPITTTPEPFLAPACEENSTYCENIPNYPTNLVKTALRMNQDLKKFAKVDYIPDIVHRANVPPDDVSLCDSVEKVVYPKIAQSKEKKWHYIVNEGEFAQGVRVEICGNEDSMCHLIDGAIEGYKTFCKQKFIYRELVAILPKGEFKREMFRFPASCCCHVKFTGSPLARIGGGAVKNHFMLSRGYRNLTNSS